MHTENASPTTETLRTNVDDVEIANPKHSTISGVLICCFFVCNNHIFTLSCYILLYSTADETKACKCAFSSPLSPMPLSLSLNRLRPPYMLATVSNVCCCFLYFILTYRILRIIFSVVASSAEKTSLQLLRRALARLAKVCTPKYFSLSGKYSWKLTNAQTAAAVAVAVATTATL